MTNLEGTAKGAGRWLLTVFYALCAGIHMILPVQNGFPSVGPIHITSIVLALAVVILVAAWPKTLIWAATDRFTLALFAFGFFATFVTYGINGQSGMYPGWEQLPLASINLLLGYIVNMAVMRLLGPKIVTRTLLCFGMIAAALILVEGVFSYRLPPYEAILLLQLSQGTDLYSQGRANGPLGNALISALQMNLVAMLAMAETKSFLRLTLVGIAIMAGLLTGSKSSLFVVLVLGGIVAYKTFSDHDVRRAKVRLGLAVVAIVLTGSIAAVAGPSAPIVGVLADRFVGSQRDASDMSTEVRTHALAEIGNEQLLEDPFHLAFGYGAGKSGEAMTRIEGSPTVDNTYLALGYDFGLPAALLFVYAMLGPFFRERSGRIASAYYTGIAVVILLFCMTFNIHLVTTVTFLVGALAARCRPLEVFV